MNWDEDQTVRYPWTAIVMTCPAGSPKWTQELRSELEFLQEMKMIYPDTQILVVDDPEKDIGSGGATLNALLVVTEHLCAIKGLNVLNGDVLLNSHILVMHNGRRSYPFEVSGCGGIPLPENTLLKDDLLCRGAVLSNYIHLLSFVEQLASIARPASGVWVCSTDMLLLKSKFPREIRLDGADCVLFSTLVTPEYASKHGVVRLEMAGRDGNPCERIRVRDIMFCRPVDEVLPFALGDRVPIVSGIVYFSIQLAECLMSLHAYTPISGCTYLGLDSGSDSLQVSLFFDLLAAMVSDMTKEAFLAGECGRSYNKQRAYKHIGDARTGHVRALVWKELRKFTIETVILHKVDYYYFYDNMSLRSHMNLIREFGKQTSIDGWKGGLLEINCWLDDVVIKESSIASDIAIVQNSILWGSKQHPLIVDMNTFVSGLMIDSSKLGRKTVLRDGVAYVGVRKGEKKYDPAVPMIFGLDDVLTCPYTDPFATFCNLPWMNFLCKTGLNAEDIWDSSLPRTEWCLANAKIYSLSAKLEDLFWMVEDSVEDWEEKMNEWKSVPRCSMRDIWNIVDASGEAMQRKEVFGSIFSRRLCRILSKSSEGTLLPMYKVLVARNWVPTMLEILDVLAMQFDYATCGMAKAARTLANIAIIIGCLAARKGGLLSGPAANKEWKPAFDILETERPGSIRDGVVALKQLRAKWMDLPHRQMRAARHYEGAAQILIRQAVSTAKQFIHIEPKTIPDMDVWVACECPARVDLFGGWTDTPPICYELGGSVINASILVNGERPIGAKVCRISEPVIVIVMDDGVKLTLTDVKDLADYNQPTNAGALAKTCLVFVGLVNLTSTKTLEEQLAEVLEEGGLELHTWSNLPRGSGLGTSSIMAGAILTVLYLVTGKMCNRSSLVHAVLCVEQMMTTGGGWQDQVGGLMGGIYHGTSAANLPLHVSMERVELTPEFKLELQSHMVLIYTGKIRLAKNLLQNVLRNWFARDSDLLKTFQCLYLHSFDFLKALKDENLAEVGRLLDEYWQLKTFLAPGAEPLAVQKLMTHLRPYTYGQTLCGAGGGGFMVILTKEPDAAETLIKGIISQTQLPGIETYEVEIDYKGLYATIDEQEVRIC